MADANGDNSKNVPHVIKFVYDELRFDEVKKTQTANCRRCRAVIQEKQGTTSAIVWHLATAAHPHLRSSEFLCLLFELFSKVDELTEPAKVK